MPGHSNEAGGRGTLPPRPLTKGGTYFSETPVTPGKGRPAECHTPTVASISVQRHCPPSPPPGCTPAPQSLGHQSPPAPPPVGWSLHMGGGSWSPPSDQAPGGRRSRRLVAKQLLPQPRSLEVPNGSGAGSSAAPRPPPYLLALAVGGGRRAGVGGGHGAGADTAATAGFVGAGSAGRAVAARGLRVAAVAAPGAGVVVPGVVPPPIWGVAAPAEAWQTGQGGLR